MANETPKWSVDVWPIPKVYFQVQWDTNVMLFQEVSGLDDDSNPVEYRHGDSPVSVIKTPGIGKYGNVTLQKGVCKSDSKFWDWFNQILERFNFMEATQCLLNI